MSLPQLAVTLAAKTADFEKAFKSAAKSAAENFADIEARALAAESKLNGTFGRIGKAAQALDGIGGLKGALTLTAGAVLGFKSLEFAINETSKAAEDARKKIADLVAIGTNSKNAGVGTSFFQSWTQQATALKVEASTLQQMLSTAKDATQYSIGTGDGAAPSSTMGDYIAKNVRSKDGSTGNLTAADKTAYDAATTQQAKIQVVLNLIQQLQSESKNLAAYDLADKMFGSDFSNKLREGVDMVGKMKEAMNGLTVAGGARIIPPDEIARAQQMDQQIQDINDKLASGLAPIRADIAKWSQEELSAWLDMEDTLAGWVQKLGEAYSAVEKLGSEITNLGNASIFKKFDDLLDSWGLIDHNLIQMGPPPATPDTAPPLTIHGDKSKPLPSDQSSKDDSDKKTKAQEFIDRLNKQAAALKAETQAFNENNAAKEVSKNLATLGATNKAAGQPTTPAQIAQVTAASQAIAGAQQQMAKLNQEKDAFFSLQDFGGNELVDFFKSAQSGASGLQQAFGRLLSSIEDMALKAAFLGTGPLGNLFGLSTPGQAGGIIGALFPTPKFAGGGMISGQGTGTSDSILAAVSNGEMIINAKSTKAYLPLLSAINSNKVPHFASGGVVGGTSGPMIAAPSTGSGHVFNVATTINANGGTPAQNQDLAKQASAQLEATMRRVVVDELIKQRRPMNLLNSQTY